MGDPVSKQKRQRRWLLIGADAVDPDNPIAVAGAGVLYPEDEIRLILTGRPCNESVTRNDPERRWYNHADPEMSRRLMIRNAARFETFAKSFGVKLKVYDGGIAPRTLVPHWVHQDETIAFGDTPRDAEKRSRLLPLDGLIEDILADPGPIRLLGGGPATGLRDLFVQGPELFPYVEFGATMFANWGPGSLMSLGGERTDYQQFNAAIDPISAWWFLTGMPCPLLLVPTETTKQPGITFATIEALEAALPHTPRAKKIVDLYRVWWRIANLEKRGGIIIYDLLPLIALDPELRERVLNVVPVEIVATTVLPYERISAADMAKRATEGKKLNPAARWGEIHLKQTTGESNRLASLPELKPGGAEVYLDVLRRICA